MNKDLLRTKEGIDEIINAHEIEIGRRISYEGRHNSPKFAPVDKKYHICLKDVQAVLREFVKENKNAKSGKNVFICKGWSNFHQRRGIGFGRIYPCICLKKEYHSSWDDKWTHEHYNIRKVELTDNGDILFHLSKKYTVLDTKVLVLDKTLCKHIVKWNNNNNIELLNVLQYLYQDKEEDGRFYWYATGVNGTPDSVVCAGKIK